MSAAAIAAGVGGQPGMRRSTGRICSSGPASWSGWPSRLRPSAQFPERGNQPRFGHRVVGGEERGLHACGDRAGDEEDVGVARRGDDAQAVLGEVVEGVGGGGQLVLAAVARAGVDVAQRERAARDAVRGAAMSRRMRRSWLSRTNIGSAVGAGVAELEALVDQRELRAAGCRRWRARVPASWRRSRCAGASRAAGRRCVRSRRRWRREGSRPGRRRRRPARMPSGCARA